MAREIRLSFMSTARWPHSVDVDVLNYCRDIINKASDANTDER
jgi:hypothetical protein